MIESKRYHNLKLYHLLEHLTWGDETCSIIVDDNGQLVLDDVWNGFDDMDYAIDTGLLTI